MKIYFAYRSGYIPNNRHLREFESASVLSWFVENWSVLSDKDRLQEFLGISPYGFPIRDHDEAEVAAPQNLKDLREKLENFTYNNEVFVAKHCVQVLTDDDEIELAWYLFDEEYAAKNAAKVSLWFHEVLPPSAAESGDIANTHVMSSTIWDSSHLSDALADAYLIEGVSVPELLDYFRGNDDSSLQEDGVNAGNEIGVLQQFCKLFPDGNQEQVFAELSRFPMTALNDLADENLTHLTIEQVREIQGQQGNPNLSRVHSSQHLIEVCSQYSGEFFNYLVVYDDHWLRANPDLGASLKRFCSTWKI